MVHKCNLEIKSIIIITFRLMIVELCFLFERLISWALYPKFILEHGLRIDGKTHSKDAKNMRLYLPTSTNDCCWIPVWYIKNHVNTHVCFLLYVFLDYIFNLKNTDGDITPPTNHRYLWTGPSPLFLEHRFFFHVCNILQLSMYHWMTYIQ